jgi:hypothetical protein
VNECYVILKAVALKFSRSTALPSFLYLRSSVNHLSISRTIIQIGLGILAYFYSIVTLIT